MHTSAATSQSLREHTLARMKRSPPQARTALLILIAMSALISSAGCVRRARSYETQTETPVTTKSSEKRININSASTRELEKLPGVGAAIAERIVQHREQFGPFRRVEHVMMVHGISEAKFRAIREMISVE